MLASRFAVLRKTKPHSFPVVTLVLLHVGTLQVNQDDLFAFALSCREFRDAWKRTHRKLRTRVRHVASSRELLRWSAGLGLPLDTRTSAYAALSGKVEVLQYCRELGCPWYACTLLSVFPLHRSIELTL